VSDGWSKKETTLVHEAGAIHSLNFHTHLWQSTRSARTKHMDNPTSYQH
jgi:hypothetical protein